jgi:hypothetical protein
MRKDGTERLALGGGERAGEAGEGSLVERTQLSGLAHDAHVPRVGVGEGGAEGGKEGCEWVGGGGVRHGELAGG